MYLTGLASGSKIIAELVLTIADKSKKAQLEAAKAQMDLAGAQLESVAKERDELLRKVEDLAAENKWLAEMVAHFELSVEYDLKGGLLFKKETGEGPYCQVDRYQMTFQGHSSENN